MLPLFRLHTTQDFLWEAKKAAGFTAAKKAARVLQAQGSLVMWHGLWLVAKGAHRCSIATDHFKCRCLPALVP
jgi:hypothetical protein